MLLACPSCATRFQVDAAALGPEGRTVRCAQCRHRWFAAPALAELAVAGDAGWHGDEALAVAEAAPADWPQAEPVEIADSPPLAPEQAPEIVIAAEDATPPRPAKSRGKYTVRRTRRAWLPQPVVAFVAAVILCSAALAARATIVGMAPALGGLYAAIGFPVNLRGLELRDVKTTREMQDGIPVLVIEGEVVNVAKHPVEIPRLRLAVLGGEGQELYSWTTLLQRSILSGDEKVAFKSRLASPPPEGRKVLVRFLTRADLTGGSH